MWVRYKICFQRKKIDKYTNTDLEISSDDSDDKDSNECNEETSDESDGSNEETSNRETGKS